MAHQEACQVFIEQEIEEGLKHGKTPYSIGKDIAAWVEKLFAAKIPHTTIEKRAERIKEKIPTNVGNGVTTESDSESEEIQESRSEIDPNYWVCVVCGETFSKEAEGYPSGLKHCKNCDHHYPQEDGECGNCHASLYHCKGTVRNINPGGPREGAGRPPKFTVQPSQEHFRTSGTGENEWYTPMKYIEAAKEVLGEIDIDPATSEQCQKRIEAKVYYTPETNGLIHQWKGNLWLNPPYAQPLITQFIEKAIKEFSAGRVRKAILLTHNYTDTVWFHLAESISSLLCFTKGRIRFEAPDGTSASPTQGSTFFYWGSNSSKFLKVFKEFGFVR